MSKRNYFPQQQGERKKAKLDISISDHNFPLSQNNDRHRGDNQMDNWGDDNDDEILLLASQACEEAYSDNISTLPDYSICMQPSSTSTQVCDPIPSTSKSTFTFKKPMTNAHNIISTKLKDKCELISSPLPGMSKVIQKTNQDNLVEDMIFNDKSYKGDADYVYRQLLQLQEENSKLKSENGKLLEKCVTKEGEVSILRTQLKSSQIAADNARLDKMKVQEKVQMEWTEKLNAANNQLQDLRTQLDFKNLEVTSIKEKCRMLESSKVKLTQVTVAKNDISTRHNNSVTMYSDCTSTQMKRFKTSSKNVQTEHPKSPWILKLNTTYRNGPNKLNRILPLTMEPTMEQPALLEYNEKLHRQTDSFIVCRVYSTFHRIPNSPSTSGVSRVSDVKLSNLYQDLAFIAADNGTQDGQERCLNVFKALRRILKQVEDELVTLARRTTTAFQKEMDERYIESSSSMLVVTDEDLVRGRPLYKEEQAITARRLTAIVYHVLEQSRAAQLLDRDGDCVSTGGTDSLIDVINRICVLLDNTSCAMLYSGFLQAVTRLLGRILELSRSNRASILRVVKTIIESRPMLFVTCETLRLLRDLVLTESLDNFCCGSSAGNLKLDYDQGVLLYKKDSCLLQVLLRQVEAALRCIERQKLRELAVALGRELLLLHSNLNDAAADSAEKASCECRPTFFQVVVYSLRICAAMLSDANDMESGAAPAALCRGGLRLLHGCALRAPAPCPPRACAEGQLLEFCEALRARAHGDLYSSMLSEVSSTWQASGEDSPPSLHGEPWLHSFRTFSVTD